MSTQTEALRIAEQLDREWGADALNYDTAQNAADELRRLHEANADLLEALDGVMYWDNGKPEWETARDAIAKHGEQK